MGKLKRRSGENGYYSTFLTVMRILCTMSDIYTLDEKCSAEVSSSTMAPAQEVFTPAFGVLKDFPNLIIFLSWIPAFDVHNLSFQICLSSPSQTSYISSFYDSIATANDSLGMTT